MCDTKKHVEKREDEICLKNLDPVGHDQPVYSVVVAHSFHSSLAHFLDRKTSFTAEKEEEEEEAGGRTLLQGLYL
jgi:hypothetical protein